MLDENVVNKNAFSVILGSYLRKHATSPKNVNMSEYKMMLHCLKALFEVI